MRQIHTHKINPASTDVEIHVLDVPGAGGACHEYQIISEMAERGLLDDQQIRFQNGPLKEVGSNGIPDEALLAILIDRLQCFQSGPHACFDNDLTLISLRAALSHMHSRTNSRVKRGVEGTNQQ